MLARKYNLILKSNDCFSTITTATQITKETKTLLDHILTNESVLEVNPEINDYRITDHSFTFVILENKMRNNKIEKSESIIKNTFFRCFKKFKIPNYCEELKEKLVEYIIQLPEVTPKNFMEEFDRFNNTIFKVIEKHTPLTVDQ